MPVNLLVHGAKPALELGVEHSRVFVVPAPGVTSRTSAAPSGHGLNLCRFGFRAFGYWYFRGRDTRAEGSQLEAATGRLGCQRAKVA